MRAVEELKGGIGGIGEEKDEYGRLMGTRVVRIRVGES
jgi:hypothetical protein